MPNLNDLSLDEAGFYSSKRFKTAQPFGILGGNLICLFSITEERKVSESNDIEAFCLPRSFPVGCKMISHCFHEQNALRALGFQQIKLTPYLESGWAVFVLRTVTYVAMLISLVQLSSTSPVYTCSSGAFMRVSLR